MMYFHRRNNTLRILDFLVIIGLVILWYGLVPMAGAAFKRYKWHIFRKRFDELRLSPLLDYSQYTQQKNDPTMFRFVGGFESITGGQTLWIRSEDLTIPVSLKNAETYLLPMQKSKSIPELFDPGDDAPEKISWERISALTEGARVFAGGMLAYEDGRWGFVSTKETPLMVIFYDGPDDSLTTQAIRAGRHRGEYWNTITPYSLAIGALCQIVIAALFLYRPAFRLTVITAIIALFVPLYPMIPPGLLFTVAYRRLAWRSRILRAYRDLARLPLRYLTPLKDKGFLKNLASLGKQTPLRKNYLLPNGELYGYTQCAELPPEAQEPAAEAANQGADGRGSPLAGKIPLLLPELKFKEGDSWYIFGALRPGEELPVQPKDSFATFGILPGKPEEIAKRCEISAYIMELTAWIILLAGIGLNIFFVRIVLLLL